MNYTIEKLLSKTYEDIITVNGLYLHSKYDPVREARQIAKENYSPHHLHIIFGVGLGYIIDSLIEELNFNEPILIIDPLIDEGIINFDKNNYKFNKIYYGNVKDEPVLSNLLSQLGSYSNKVQVIIGHNYKELFPEQLSRALQLIRNSQIREVYNLNTINLFSMQWQLNSFFNIRHMIGDYSLERLFNKYDVPVVIASGGPSLTKQINNLKKFRNKIILICAGSTINSLLKNNISPDYVVTIDGGIANYNHFKDISLNNTDILYAPTSHYKIRESFKRNGFVFINGGMRSLQGYFKNITNDIFPIIPGGGSVAHYALSIAKRITSGPICLVGQDLAYTNQMTHATGNLSAKNAKEVNKKLLKVEGYYNDIVETNDSFNTMIDTFEQLQLADPHRNTTYNCTEGGAKIKLFEQLPFEDFLKRYCKKNVEKYTIQNEKVRNFSFEKFTEEQFYSYQQIIKYLEKGIKITLKENGPYFKTNTIASLSKIDKKLNHLYTMNNLDTLLEPIIIKNENKYLPKMDESKLEEFERVKNYTVELYSDCKKRLLEYTEYIKREIGEENE